MLSFFSRPPLTALFIAIYKGGKRFLTRLKNDIFEHIFWVRSKLKRDVNISPFVNYFMLKNPWALGTMCPFSFFRRHLLSTKKRTFYPSTYSKIPKISTRAYILQRPSLRGLYSKGLCTEGNLLFKIDWASLILGRIYRFSLFYFVFEGNFQVQALAG